MKKDGFTLIELLLVIVIVASISITASIVFSEVTNSTEKQDLKNIYLSVQRAGKTYVDLNDNWTRDFNGRGFITVSLSELQSTNYISDNLKNPIDNTQISPSDVVMICITDDITESVRDENGNLHDINVGRYVDSCILSKNNICLADGTGEYEEAEKNCNECCTK